LSKRKWTHIGCGAAFGLILLLGACTAVLFAVVDDTPPEQAQKKEEPKVRIRKRSQTLRMHLNLTKSLLVP